MAIVDFTVMHKYLLHLVKPAPSQGISDLTICIPFYNASNSIISCLQSVLTRSNRNLRLLMCDDCSSDSTTALAARYLSKHFLASHILSVKLIQNSVNKGPSATRNLLASCCESEYLLFLDADDFLLPKFDSIIDFILKNNLNLTKNVIYFVGRKIDIGSRLDVLKSSNPQRSQFYNFSAKSVQASVNLIRYFRNVNQLLIHRSVYSSQFFNSSLTVCEDIIYMLEILNSEEIIICSSEVTYFNDLRTTNHVKVRLNRNTSQNLLLIHEHLSLLPWSPNKTYAVSNIFYSYIAFSHCRVLALRRLIKSKDITYLQKLMILLKALLSLLLPFIVLQRLKSLTSR